MFKDVFTNKMLENAIYFQQQLLLKCDKDVAFQLYKKFA